MVRLFKREEPVGVEEESEEVTLVPEPEVGKEEEAKVEAEAPSVARQEYSGGGSGWVNQAESKLREAQQDYETEKLRQDILTQVTEMDHQKMTKIKDRLYAMR